MRRLARIALATVLLGASAERLPAPISEEKPAPTPSKIKEARPKHISNHATDANPVGQFEGTWQVTTTEQNQVYSATGRRVLVFKKGAVEASAENTATLLPGQLWTGWPAPYNSQSPVWTKTVARSTDLNVEGSNLRARWQGYRVSEWSPNTIPVQLFQTPDTSKPWEGLYILRGKELISIVEGKTRTWSRAR